MLSLVEHATLTTLTVNKAQIFRNFSALFTVNDIKHPSHTHTKNRCHIHGGSRYRFVPCATPRTCSTTLSR